MSDISSFYSALSIRKVFRPQNADGKQSRIADYFASNVFDLRAMVKRLSAQDLETMTKVMK